jgi:tetratricopeptide (TPR) repeat protein
MRGSIGIGPSTGAGRVSDGNDGMASKKTLNAKNLEALGAERLAELLIEISTGNVAAKRRLRLELAGAHSPAEVAHEVRKRLATIARSRSFVDWQNRRALAEDLETQHRAIVEQVAKADPAEALDLMWRFMELANSVFGRCDDSSGTVIGIFHQACSDLGEIAEAAKPHARSLADRAFTALSENDYGQYDNLIEVLAPVLGQQGLEHLKARFIELSQAAADQPPKEEREVIGWSTSGPIYADEIAAHQRDSTIRMALQDIADLQGDVDGFIAQHSEQARTMPAVAAEIAQRLLAAGRAEEAWSAINAIDENRPGWIPFEWEETRLEVMEALGRTEEAQAFRWACFERTLDAEHLRAYVKRLPDFDDLEAEQRAIAHAREFSDVHQALGFLVSWPALDQAAGLVLERLGELSGDHYGLLAPAADALADRHPLAATLLLRAMIEFSLKQGRVKRYRHAARHLSTCAILAPNIANFDAVETHEAFVARLLDEHGRKSSFWGLVS